MTDGDSHTRRDCLRTMTGAGAAVGGSVVGVSSVGAVGRSHRRGRGPGDVDPDDISLEAACVDADGDAALFCVDNEGDRPAHLEWTTAPVEEGVYFIDCQTVRVVGDFAQVLIEAAFTTDSGIGEVFVRFGGVDGSAVFDITDSPDVEDDWIVRTVDAFREGTPVIPYGGDISVRNPDYEACQEEYFGEVVDSAASGTATGGSSTADGDRDRVVVPPNQTRCFAVSADDGLATVTLFADGEAVATASSATAGPCETPIRPGRGRGRR